jgi:hypothetical protein
MHLKEYDFIELGELLTHAGFRSPRAVLSRRRPFTVGPFVSELFFRYCCAWDRIARKAKLSPRNERVLRSALRLALVPTNIWLVAEK